MESGPKREAFEQETSTLYPIQFMQVKGKGSLPAPLVRISTCGLLTIELLQEVVNVDPPQGRYTTLSSSTLQGRGTNSAISLLKLLVSRPHRFASKDWLVEKLRRNASVEEEEEDGPGFGRLDNVASQVRTLFVSALQQREDLEQVRLLLLTFLRTGRESGPGYQLAAYPLIWLDTDAIAWNVERGAILDSFRDEHALPLWERAYELASRGEYLVDEGYSDWAQDPRQRMQGYLRQCVRVLARHYVSLFGERGEERAIFLLRTYVLEHPTEEDALRPLMELLGKRECFQEALEYYQRLCELLEEEGCEPDPRTKKVGLYLQTRKLQRERAATSNGNDSTFPKASSSLRLPQRTMTPQMLPQSWNGLLQTQPQTQSFNGAESWLDEQTVGTWLALAAGYLAPVFDQGWQVDAIVEVLNIVLPVVRAMPISIQHVLLQAGNRAILGRVPFVLQQITEEEQMRLSHALSESIATGWMLFHTTGNRQILAVSETLVFFTQYLSPYLCRASRPLFSSGAYRLKGAALFFQEDYIAANHAQEGAYYAALEGADAWNMAQCRTWQAYGYQAVGQYASAIETIEAVLRLIADQEHEPYLRLRSHLLACWAENATLIQEYSVACEKLQASELLLKRFEPNEEFDYMHWLHIAGVCAFHRKDYSTAIRYFEEALKALPLNWIMRYTITAMPLAVAYARLGERDTSLAVAKKATTLIRDFDAPIMNRQFVRYVQQDLLKQFPHDTSVNTFLLEVRDQLPHIAPLMKMWSDKKM